MSDNKNLDLPTRLPLAPLRPQSGGTALNEQQQTIVIESGARLLEDCGQIARDLVAIQKIRAESEKQVDEIDADTRRQVDVIRAQVEKIRAGHDGVRTKGQVIRGIIADISAGLCGLSSPEDAAARKELVAGLPRLVELAVAADEP